MHDWGADTQVPKGWHPPRWNHPGRRWKLHWNNHSDLDVPKNLNESGKYFVLESRNNEQTRKHYDFIPVKMRQEEKKTVNLNWNQTASYEASITLSV